MPILALKLLGALGWLKKAAVALLGLAMRYPWQAALIVAVCVSGWLWHGKGKALDQRDAARAQIVEMEAASKANAAALEKQRRDAQARYDTLAKESEHDRKQMDAPAYAGLVRFVAANRLRTGPANISAANPVAETESPGVRQAVPGGDVMVSEADLRICTARTLDYLALRDWALKVGD